MPGFAFAGRKIGDNQPAYFIADIAANHDGRLDRALELIRLAAAAGADAAKFQNFHAEKIVSEVGFQGLGRQLDHQKTWNKPVVEVYREASIPGDWTEALWRACREAGIDYFSTPYDQESVDLLDPFVPVYKIGSGDITHTRLIDSIAAKGKPVFIATGASVLEDVTRAMDILLAHQVPVVLMQCNTNYTGAADGFASVNLRVLETYRRLYPGAVLGLSDHTPGHAAVLGAVALGAKVVEKHFTDDNARPGPDHGFSMTPAGWREMVDRTRELEQALGDGVKRIEANELQTMVVQRRALRAVRDLPAGHALTPDDLEALRPIPEDGLPPYELDALLGKTLARALGRGEHLTRRHLART
ncbi:N-acetylneuraminate synthase (plasmid) [Solidesulfovibrio carbinoliphilus subsp. oakridgensis]|uniref:N-acetylneuraminate synthase n=1 Tax=Solidesulfovibrio carbinoliphilus subsp. oakridgensis TaxID=694327 RepID=G7QE67_9BACT|nr:N-acetylneuraminate synthase family protein [Solidesulfovibrio carbinoliphilus]EHJ45961.1 N-acetylneuraminate synthase [Solidesulfovibrio carbinoliphilus subsp. oakridgensis]